jgi:uncharacterized protein with PIN domain
MEEAIANKTAEDIAYVFFVHGCVPEFMPHTAFRRVKHFQTANRKIIKCPFCQNTFTTIDENEKVELYRHPKKANVIYHDFLSCRTCRNTVGIIYASG